MSPSVNMHDLTMCAEWNRWFYAIGAAYHNIPMDPPKNEWNKWEKSFLQNEW